MGESDRGLAVTDDLSARPRGGGNAPLSLPTTRLLPFTLEEPGSCTTQANGSRGQLGKGAGQTPPSPRTAGILEAAKQRADTWVALLESGEKIKLKIVFQKAKSKTEGAKNKRQKISKEFLQRRPPSGDRCFILSLPLLHVPLVERWAHAT